MRRAVIRGLLLALAGWSCASPEPPSCPDAAPAAPDAAPKAPDATVDAGFKIIAGRSTFEAEPLAPPPSPAPEPRLRTHRPTKATLERRAATPRTPAAARSAEQVIRGHFGEVSDCYAQAAAANPSLGGRLTLRWTLDKDGGVSAVAVVSDTIGSPAVASCVKARAKTWRFPAPGAGVSVVTYPFDLRMQ